MASNEHSSATDPNTVAPTSSTVDNSSGYSKRHSRITKENLFMILALWMQDFPLEDDEDPGNSGDPKPLRKVGAVLVSPNDIVYAVDCTRDGVHGIARLLIKHHDIPEGCKVFVSRKPCSFCTKLLVQSGKVKRVFYLPFEPEYCDSRTLDALIKVKQIDEAAESPETLSEEEKAENEKIVEAFVAETVRVDSLFKASAIGQSMFVPIVEKAVLDDAEERKKTPVQVIEDIKSQKQVFFDKYYKETWMKETKDRLPWPAFDELMKDQVEKDFKDAMGWMARVLILLEKANTFILSPLHPTKTTNMPFNPVANKLQREQAAYLLNMAQFLAQRSDDPKTGVGAIITDQKMEIKALGWNGFPLKALYGEFPRASKDDQVETDKKYPFVIHAEQNALLMRNDKTLERGTLFVTKMPCNECVPLLEMQGINTVISDEESKIKSQESATKKGANVKHLSYAKFPEKVRDGVFICFERHGKGITPSESRKKGIFRQRR